ncbi:CDP-glycerol glycerophosphotransferase family protein [Litchfieldia alkalitelluris]|uniref:CDP-glycerol glycerophosphotransferase family protein n=1 Tax=Litchfieldia alkalitelluris TaxID=304268 RepID=UPI001116B415|nr:CDP-glycerol glycerophosphotransferase family protein [Litchfieldia alkalitelluris]
MSSTEKRPKRLNWKERSFEVKMTTKTDKHKNNEVIQSNAPVENAPKRELVLDAAGTLPPENYIPRRKVTKLKWNGPIFEIQGYYYLENLPLLNDDMVKKSLVLINASGEKTEFPLKDKNIRQLKIDKEHGVDDLYLWSGFQGKYNLATDTSDGKPLPAGTYTVYLKLEVYVSTRKKYEQLFSLGNINEFLNDGFYSTKMEYFSAKREMKFNLLATYDEGVKTLKIKSTKLKDFNPAELTADASRKKGLFYRFFKKYGFKLFYMFFTLFPLQTKKVLFASDSRTDMSGNFEFVFAEMQRRDLDFDYHFSLRKTILEEKSYKEMIELAYHLATSKFIVLDDFYPMVYPLRIRANAELVQLWHAVGAFKTFGYSRIGRPGGPSPLSKNHRNYTKAIVSSKNVAKHYAEGFGIDIGHIVPTGIPRTDIFFDQDYQNRVKNDLYEQFPYLKDKKVIMFAPTFRGNGQQSAHYPMEVLDLDKLYKKFKDEYVFLFKVHPFVKNDWSIPYQYSDFFYDFSEYREINDLLFVTDVLITDYSSVCFEFALLNKPMVFFAFDVAEYVQERDFYYDYHSFIPGPLVRSTGELIKTIETGNFKMEKIHPFVNYFFENTDGKSSARVVDQIFLEQQGNDENLK